MINALSLPTAPQWLVEKMTAPKETSPRAKLSQRLTGNGPRRAPSGADNYAIAALTDECAGVQAAPSGTRNDQLNKAAFSLGQLVAGGHLEKETTRTALIDSAILSGLVADDGLVSVEATIESGFNAGQLNPRENPQNTFRKSSANDNDSQESPLKASSFELRDASKIPLRPRLYGNRLIRGFVSVTVAPGGVGKSSLAIAEALDMVTGRRLFNEVKEGKTLRVWVINLEDPFEEIERRIVATCIHFHISKEQLEDRLFVDSGRDQPLCIAETTREGTVIVRPKVNELIAELLRRQIDVLIVDPFVSSHLVNENDNSGMDLVAKEWNQIAEHGKVAVDLIHHTRKMGEGTVNTESARGAKALTDAARSVRVINKMTETEATESGVECRQSYFRADDDKSNLSPPADRATWFRIKGVHLLNGSDGLGDNVGVVTPWKYPDAFDGVTNDHLIAVQNIVQEGEHRESAQSPDWFGHEIAPTLSLDTSKGHDKAKIKRLLQKWTTAGYLKVENRTINGVKRPIYVLGIPFNPIVETKSL